jgi:eukaryotic-like serine/threonine-protein kinase
VNEKNAPQPPSPEPADSLIGTLLAGRYRILSLIGEGAMGAVYLGEHVRIGRRDAIKVLRNGIGNDPESMSRFVRGARNVSLIRHPNVCTIYDFSDTAEGRQFLAMEFIEGETLKEILDREGRLEPARALRITQQVADALHAAHEVGVIHRDLKPGNIMISRRPDGSELVKVVDFDIAKGPDEAAGEEVTRLGFVVGTPEYMSPEQLIGERLDGRSDLYSLAVVLFRMLTAALPFRSTSTQDMMIERLTAAPITLEEALPSAQLPPQLGAIIAKALSRRREDRQESTASFARDLATAVAGTAEPPPSTPVASGRPPAGAPAPTPAQPSPAPTHAVPPTVVAPAAAGTLPRSARRGLLAAGAVALVAAISVGAIAIFRPFGDGAPAADTGAAVEQPAATAPAGGPEAGSAAGVALPRTPVVPDATEPPERGRPQDAQAAQPQPTGAQSPPGTIFAAQLSVVLDRQLAALTESPGPAALRAITDTAAMAWEAARTRNDSATAALTLAQAALLAGRDDDCRRWARQAAQLGASGASVILQVCG